MTAGSSGIMIDALVWPLGLLLFGRCLDKQVHKTSHTSGNKRLLAGKHQSLLSQKREGMGTFASPLLAEYSTGLR